MTPLAALFTGLALLAANAFFVAGEFALVSARRTQIEPKAKAGSGLARQTLKAMDNVALVMAAVQLGITLASLGLGAIAEPALAHVLEPILQSLQIPTAALHPIAFTIALLIVVYLHVVLGEMVPKNIALAGPDRMALLLGAPMMAFVTVLKPFIRVLNAIADAIIRLLKLEPTKAVASTYTREEVAALVDESREGGMLADEEYSRLTGAIGFTSRNIASVLLRSNDIQTVTKGAKCRDVESICADTGFSRFPVIDGGDLVGYLHIKDVLETDELARSRDVEDKWIRPFANLRVSDTLQAALTVLLAKGAHMARVVDENGLVVGIATLEDVIEELVGEIRDGSHSEAKL